ncbi:carbon-nitrogen hydrolase family protein [Ferroplasma sp.]|uniref:carbon-nitrogen hydrolase family protein n=1 Tax=Ferroplasma sp. TaxID=2591003 RepID=UPI002611A56B|nr:carbon-nitrogen hydrolase family protein [Ferroplasma sp.]MCL4453715.1 carbon-nitrogen hydrolase family protein [Candidatus Thermoplasmatota archaeon]
MKLKIRGVQSRRMALHDATEYLSSLHPESDEIIVFPEKFITEKINSSNLDTILNSIRFNNTVILGSLSYMDRFLFNRSFIIRNRKIIGWQDKINLYRAEAAKYTPGNELKIFDMGNYRAGILVCYDLDFPDYPRMLFRDHCDVIFNPSLIRKDFHREWHLYVKTRSLENRIPVISINSISDDFMGDSIIAYPHREEGGVRLDIVQDKKDDIVYTLDTDAYATSREERLREEKIMLEHIRNIVQ